MTRTLKTQRNGHSGQNTQDVLTDSSEKKKKTLRKVTNWPEYNDALVKRGQFTLWINEDVAENWRHKNFGSKVGRQFIYSDLAIETLLTIREFFRLTYRATEGFGKSITQLIGLNIEMPAPLTETQYVDCKASKSTEYKHRFNKVLRQNRCRRRQHRTKSLR